MTTSQHIRIYEILAKHFRNAEEKFQNKKEFLATKQDVSDLKVEMVDRIHKAKIETIVWIVGVGVMQIVVSLLLRKIGG